MPHSRHVSASKVWLHVTFLPVIQSIMEIFKQTEWVRKPFCSVIPIGTMLNNNGVNNGHGPKTLNVNKP